MLHNLRSGNCKRNGSTEVVTGQKWVISSGNRKIIGSLEVLTTRPKLIMNLVGNLTNEKFVVGGGVKA